MVYGLRRFPGVSREVQDALEAFAAYLDAAGFVVIEPGEGGVEAGAVRAEEVLRDYLQYGDF